MQEQERLELLRRVANHMGAKFKNRKVNMSADDWFQELYIVTAKLPDDKFCFTIIKNKAIDIVRKLIGQSKKRTDLIGGDIADEVAAKPEHLKIFDETSMAFMEDLLHVDKILGTCVREKVLHGKKYRETCEENGWKEQQIWYRLGRLRDFLGSRKALESCL